MFDIAPEERLNNPIQKAKEHAKQPKIKRFYDNVAIVKEGNYHLLTLDGKRAKTPKKQNLQLPNEALAKAVMHEWEEQGEFIMPFNMPLTRLSNVAIDMEQKAIPELCTTIMSYLDYDSACFLHSTPQELAAIQQERLSPIFSWVSQQFNTMITTTDSLQPPKQNPQLIEKMETRIKRRSPFELIAFYNLTSLSASLFIGSYQAAHLEDDKTAWQAANIEEDWNIHLWGEDEESKSKRLSRQHDWQAALKVLRSYL